MRTTNNLRKLSNKRMFRKKFFYSLDCEEYFLRTSSTLNVYSNEPDGNIITASQLIRVIDVIRSNT